MYLVVFDGEQDEAFLVLDKERLLFLFYLGVFLFLLGCIVDDVFLANENSGVFFSLAGTRKFLLEGRDREVAFLADLHF